MFSQNIMEPNNTSITGTLLLWGGGDPIFGEPILICRRIGVENRHGKIIEESLGQLVPRMRWPNKLSQVRNMRLTCVFFLGETQKHGLTSMHGLSAML